MSTNQQQYVKNTNVPDKDSEIWQFGNNWRISGSSGEVYCPLKYDPVKELSDVELFSNTTKMINKEPIAKWDYFEGQTQNNKFFFVVSPTKDGSVLLYAYTDEGIAKKKVETVLKFNADFVPKVQIMKEQKQQQQLQTPTTETTGIKTNTPTQKVVENTPTAPVQSYPLALELPNITSFTEPRWVMGDSNDSKELESKGYSYIPSSLANPNTRVVDVYDTDEEGNKVTIGEQQLFLMGRIINVKIGDK